MEQLYDVNWNNQEMAAAATAAFSAAIEAERASLKSATAAVRATYDGNSAYVFDDVLKATNECADALQLAMGGFGKNLTTAAQTAQAAEAKNAVTMQA